MNRRSVGRSLPSLSFFLTILSLNSLQLALILGAAHYLPTGGFWRYELLVPPGESGGGEAETCMLPCTSHTIRFLLVPRVRRGVGLAGVQERDLSSFAAISASSLDCSKTLAISLSSLSFSLALFLSSFWDFFIAHSRASLSLSEFF